MEGTKKCVYWIVVLLSLMLVMAICAMVPAKAHAADTSSAKLVAASVDKSFQSLIGKVSPDNP